MRLVAGDTALMTFSHLALHEAETRTQLELASAIGRAPQVVQAALRSLVADGLVLAVPKAKGTGRGAVYSVNRASPIYPELRQIAVKILGGTALLRDALVTNPAVDAAAIFGSMASGSDRRTGALSDIDLLVVFADTATRDERYAVRDGIGLIAAQLHREINVQAHSQSEWDQAKGTNRTLKRIASGALIVLKGEV